MIEWLKEIVAHKFQLDAATLSPDSNMQDLDLDSLDLVELSLILEHELGVQVSDTELADLERLDDVVQLLESRGAKPDQPTRATDSG